MHAIKTLSGCIIGIVMVFLIPCSLKATQVLNYEKEGFSVTVPNGWIAVPNYMVTSAMRVASQFATTTPTRHYQYGFQLDTGGSWFIYPYILIGIKPLKPISTVDLELIVNLQHTKKIDKVKDILKPLIGKMKVKGINYEPSSRIIWLRIDTNHLEHGEISSISGIILTTQGAIQVTGFTKRNEFEQYFPLFEQIIRSVKVAQPVVYPSLVKDSQTPYSYWHLVVAGIVVSFIFALLFWLVAFLSKKPSAGVVAPLTEEPTPLVPIKETPALTRIQAVEEIEEVNAVPNYPLILPKTQSYYDMLGVTPQADETEIKRAAQIKLKEVRAELEALGAHERSVYGKIAKAKGERIKKAFHTLSDSKRRKEYDAKQLLDSTNTYSQLPIIKNGDQNAG